MIKLYILYNSHEIGFFLITSIHCDTPYKTLFENFHYYTLYMHIGMPIFLNNGNININ